MVNVEREIPREKKVGFTSKQREWVKRAYERVLGFSGCVFPVWNGEEYVYCKNQNTEVHHIKPRGWCIRVLHIEPNVPGNAAPLCAEHHRIGQRNKPLTRKDQDVIHLDAAYAIRNYKGVKKPTVFDKVFDQRRRLTDELKPYWYQLWDSYLLELAEEIMEAYQKVEPWPQRH